MLTFARVMGFVLLFVLGGQGWSDAPLPADAMSQLGKGPWPGMTAWDAAWCKELVYAAQVVEVRQEGLPVRLLWVKDARGWLKPNGFYGLKINSVAVDEAEIWLAYAGKMTNLRLLFTYGSLPVSPTSGFRD